MHRKTIAGADRPFDFTGDVLGDHEGPLLVTTGTKTATAAGERHEELVAAPRAADPREALVEVTAGQEVAVGLGDDGPPEAVALLVAVVVDALKVVEVSIEQLPQW